MSALRMVAYSMHCLLGAFQPPIRKLLEYERPNFSEYRRLRKIILIAFAPISSWSAGTVPALRFRCPVQATLIVCNLQTAF